MSLANAVFITGPFGAIIMVPLAVWAAAVLRHPRWAIVMLVAAIAGTITGWLCYWVLWYAAFDDLDAGKQVPAAVNWASNAAMVLSAGGAGLLAIAAAVTFVLSRRAQAAQR